MRSYSIFDSSSNSSSKKSAQEWLKKDGWTADDVDDFVNQYLPQYSCDRMNESAALYAKMIIDHALSLDAALASKLPPYLPNFRYRVEAEQTQFDEDHGVLRILMYSISQNNLNEVAKVLQSYYPEPACKFAVPEAGCGDAAMLEINMFALGKRILPVMAGLVNQPSRSNDQLARLPQSIMSFKSC